MGSGGPRLKSVKGTFVINVPSAPHLAPVHQDETEAEWEKHLEVARGQALSVLVIQEQEEQDSDVPGDL